MSNQIHTEAYNSSNTNANASPSNSKNQKEKHDEVNHQLSQMLRNVAEDSVNFVKDNFNEYYHKGQEKVQDVEKNVEEKIKLYPFKSLLIALGAGYVLGKLHR